LDVGIIKLYRHGLRRAGFSTRGVRVFTVLNVG
jgi:hypothetical protein